MYLEKNVSQLNAELFLRRFSARANILSALSSAGFLVFFSRVKAKAATRSSPGERRSSTAILRLPQVGVFPKPSNGFEGCRYEIDPRLSFCRGRSPIRT